MRKINHTLLIDVVLRDIPSSMIISSTASTQTNMIITTKPIIFFIEGDTRGPTTYLPTALDPVVKEFQHSFHKHP